MPHHLGTLHPRLAGTVAGAAMAVLALAGCGSRVLVSSHINPVPRDCVTARPASASDSFASAATLQPGPSGLQFADLRVGCGAVAAPTANVNVQFTVWLSTGAQIITTRGPSAPTSALQLGSTSTLGFWRLGVPGMHVGGTRRLVVPPALGFGAAGNTSAGVPPNATLVIDVELVSLG